MAAACIEAARLRTARLQTGQLQTAWLQTARPGIGDLEALRLEAHVLKPATAYAVVTWEQLHRDARALAGALMDQRFTGIVAVTRGGLIPAAIVARELEIRLVESISVVSYAAEAGTASAPRIVKAAAAAADGAGFLVIDDLVDSGQTARAVRAALPAAHFACLYAKPAGRPFTHRFVAEVPQDTWILFPWDTAPLFVPPLARKA